MQPHVDVLTLSLGHNVASEDDVDGVLAQAEAAGAAIIAPARQQNWGGRSGYFTDPDGFRWEVVYNPGLTVDADGAVRFTTQALAACGRREHIAWRRPAVVNTSPGGVPPLP